MVVATRIAPSPTGNLHLGTVRTALYNVLLARNLGGKFYFRLEDTDRERSKEEFTQEIIDGFKWLGITWDGAMIRQSERASKYKNYVDQLIKSGRAYRCFATTEELQVLREEQRANKLPEGYDNRSRNLSEDQIQANLANNKAFVIRLNLGQERDITWNDMVRGEMSINTKDLGGDLVIQKSDGQVLYNFAVVIDDHEMGITHVVRGEDHLTNTAKQIAIYQALEFAVPEFGHLPLIFTTDRQKLSKRKHGDIAGVDKYRKEGYLPEALVNYLLATSYTPTDSSIGEVYTLDSASKSFDIKGLSKSPAVYDLKKLDWYNREYMSRLNQEDLLVEFKKYLRYNLDSKFTKEQQLELIGAVSGNCNNFSEINNQVSYFFEDEFVYTEEFTKILDAGKPILQALLSILESSEDLSALVLKDQINKIGESLGLKGKQLFWPIRIALSNSSHGPDLGLIISLLGKDSCMERLSTVI